MHDMSEPAPITFQPAGFSGGGQNIFKCDTCGALVNDATMEDHYDWHGALQQTLARMKTRRDHPAATYLEN